MEEEVLRATKDYAYTAWEFNQTRKKSIEDRSIWRGKSLDDDNFWLYGYLTSIFSNNKAKINDIFVDKETVSQYSGYDDKNNKPIFEGDIIRITSKGEDKKQVIRGVVIYTKESWQVDIGYAEHKNMFSKFDLYPCFDDYFDIEIIGNIWDDKELLTDRTIVGYFKEDK